MCQGGCTDLLLLQMAVRSVVCLLFRVGSDVLILANFTGFDVTFTSAIQQNLAECFLRKLQPGLSNSLTVPLSISQKMLLFLQAVSAPSPDVLKEDEISSMTTYSVPKISFSSISFEMNTEPKKLDRLLMAYIPVCGSRMSRSLPFPCLSSGVASKSLVLLLEAGADNW